MSELRTLLEDTHNWVDQALVIIEDSERKGAEPLKGMGERLLNRVHQLMVTEVEHQQDLEAGIARRDARIHELTVALNAVIGNLDYLASPDHYGKDAAYDRLRQIVMDVVY